LQNRISSEAIISKSYKKLTGFFLSGYFILKPFYIFRSGLPQLSDFFLAFLVLINFFNKNIILKSISNNQESRKVTIKLLFFVYYIFLINLIWTYITSTIMILPSFWYLYNFFSFLVVISMFYIWGIELYNLLYKSITISVTIQFILSFFVITTGARTTLFFNNPNQLGYFGLLSLSILVLVIPKIKVNLVSFFIGITFSVALIIMSVSNAAIISGGLLIIFFCLSSINHNKIPKKYGILIILFIVFILLFYIINPTILFNIEIIEKINRRMVAAQALGMEQIKYRRYDMIFNNIEYLFFGAGEGNTRSRFGYGEIHSTFGVILFSYGIIGLGTFLLIVQNIIRKQKLYDYYPIIFCLLYGLVHNGIRHTYLWMIFGIVLVNKVNFEKGVNRCVKDM